jgi:flagellar hook-associated protein 2
MATVSSTSSASTTSSLAITGLASGMDWSTVISQLAAAERSPETKWKQTQANLNSQNSIFDTIKTDLSTLQTDIKNLQDPSLYDSRAVQTSNSAVATATTDPGAKVGTFTFNISHLATAAQLNGAGNISQALAPNGDLSTVTVGTAGFGTTVIAGTFTINGSQVSVAATDSLQDVFNKISDATNGNVTASYNAGSDKITLTSGDNSEIVLGSATDTSNFLQAAQLYNNGQGAITSNGMLGSVRLTAGMADSGLATAIGGDVNTSQGRFMINGVTIDYNVNDDSIQDVLDRINNSSAGVTASYDVQNDRFVVANNTTGDVGIAMQDLGSGNFLAATGLTHDSGAALVHGQNLVYTVSNGPTALPGQPQLISQSNTITAASSNITGLSLTALTAGTVTVTVNSDTSKISSAVQTFVNDYNNVQNYISSQMIVSHGSDGKTTPGPLTGDLTAARIASNLRSILSSVVSVAGLPGSMNQMADLGIKTNGQNNSVKFDTSALNTALTNSLSSVKTLFSDPTSGWSAQANTSLDKLIGDNGTLVNHQTTLTNQSNSINTQISTLETKVNADTAKWKSEFQAMELAQSKANQTLTYLSQQITSGAL